MYLYMPFAGSPGVSQVSYLFLCVYSSSNVSRCIYHSMAALNAAKPSEPRAIAEGPCFRASHPPTKNPAMTGLVESDLARYWKISKRKGWWALPTQ
jgi:hypothetical protein